MEVSFQMNEMLPQMPALLLTDTAGHQTRSKGP
jgi:hypothetical protein